MNLVGGWRLYECPEYTFDLDEYELNGQQMITVHVRFRKWSPRAMKHLLNTFNTFRQVVDCPLYAFGEEISDKYTRFVTRFGFKPTSAVVTCGNGEKRPLFVSYKDPAGQ
jgi:hypothetical protein